ncbi:MAG: isochorismatase family protein [Burkholderiales bacterium]|nr:isochorismatase family protein [Burkholderiales bacterium]
MTQEPTMNAIDAATSVLVLVDYQGRLMPVIHEGEAVVARALRLARAAHALDVPVVGTEQNRSGLGPNLDAIREACALTLSKTHFDACADGLVQALEAAAPGRDQVVIAGCEAHVCMMQTALGLLRAGRRVWVVANASGSRRAFDHAAAMARLSTAGATIVTHEMVLFEWLHDCRHPRFREVLQIVKEEA